MEDNLNYTNSLTQENQNNSLQTIEITPTLRQDFTSTLKWGKFFAIMMFVGAGIMVLISILTWTVSSVLDEMDLESFPTTIGFASQTIIYLIVALIYVVLGYFLLKSVNKFQNGLQQNVQQDTNDGMHNLKLFMQISGVITIVSMACMLLVMICVVVLTLSVA